MADYARGAEFRRLREERHLTQEDAAHELGFSTKTIRSWEKGKGITWEHAKAVAKFYGVDPEGLVNREITEAPEAEGLSRLEEAVRDLQADVRELGSSLAALAARLPADDDRGKPETQTASPRRSRRA